MNDAVREVLSKLIAERGPALARDRARLGGFLRDECGEAKREINLLVDAIDERIVEDLLAPGDEPVDAAVARLAQRLIAHRGTNPEAAHWAVTTWAVALGRLDPHVAPAPYSSPERHSSSSPHSSPAPSPAPAPEPAPVPPVGVFEQFLRLFRTPAGRPRWMPIGLAVAAVAGLIAVRATDDKAPRILRVEMANTVFDGTANVRAKLIGDGRRYPAKIWFEDKDGDVRSLMIRNLKGVWSTGNDTNTRAVNMPGRVSGAIESETFSYTGTGSAEIALVLVDAAGRRSPEFLMQYDAEAPPKPVPQTQPSGNARVQLPFNVPPINVPIPPLRR